MKNDVSRGMDPFLEEEPVLDDDEQADIYYKYFTLASLLSGKKLSLQNIIVLTIEDKVFFNIAKEMLDVDSRIEFMQHVLALEPSLAKSKILLAYGNECIERRKNNPKRKSKRRL